MVQGDCNLPIIPFTKSFVSSHQFFLCSFRENLENIAYPCSNHCQFGSNMSTLILLLLTIHGRTVIAAPFQNTTDTRLTSTWKSDPPGRGTTGILYNSACCLALCIWNSVHLNIPVMREGRWVTYRRKTKWVIIALLAPELLVFTAFQQWLAARKFLRELKYIQDERKPEVST